MRSPACTAVLLVRQTALTPTRVFSSGSSIVRLFCSPTVVWFVGGALTASALKIALQIGDKYRVTTPVNWKKGDDVIVHPTVSNEEAKTLFPEFKIHKVSTSTPAGDGAAGKDGSKRCSPVLRLQPYLRTTPLKVE